jgi:hypothetical protein
VAETLRFPMQILVVSEGSVENRGVRPLSRSDVETSAVRIRINCELGRNLQPS